MLPLLLVLALSPAVGSGQDAMPGPVLAGMLPQGERPGSREPTLPSTPAVFPGALQDPEGPGDLAATLASAALPGSGQLLQGRSRWALFVAAEVVAWGVHLDARSDGRRLRDHYRDLAWSVARGAPEPRVDGDFDYYERLAAWTRSGAYDTAPGVPHIQPERDPDSYNGRQWRLAADLWLGGDVEAGPEAVDYDEALAFYRSRAYRDPFTWDWSVAPGEQDRYAGLIEESDGRLQTASIALGAVVANHVLSAVDAFVAARTGGSGGASLRLAPDIGRRSGGLIVRARIPLPRDHP